VAVADATSRGRRGRLVWQTSDDRAAAWANQTLRRDASRWAEVPCNGGDVPSHRAPTRTSLPRRHRSVTETCRPIIRLTLGRMLRRTIPSPHEVRAGRTQDHVADTRIFRTTE